MKFIVLSGFFLTTFALASGWDCRGNDGYSVKIRNSTTAPRKPALFLITYRGNNELRATEEYISKKNLTNGVRYTADNLADVRYILFVAHNEATGPSLGNGDKVYGKLIERYDGTESKFDLVCVRYLKNN